MTALGVTKTQLEKRAGLAKGSGGRYASGARGKNPGADIVLRIANALRVNPEWLVNGEGPMLMTGDVKIRDPQPNRVPIYGSPEYRDAEPKVQEWLTAQRLPRDISTDDWMAALGAASTLFRLGLLPGARARR